MFIMFLSGTMFIIWDIYDLITNPKGRLDRLEVAYLEKDDVTIIRAKDDKEDEQIKGHIWRAKMRKKYVTYYEYSVARHSTEEQQADGGKEQVISAQNQSGTKPTFIYGVVSSLEDLKKLDKKQREQNRKEEDKARPLAEQTWNKIKAVGGDVDEEERPSVKQRPAMLTQKLPEEIEKAETANLPWTGSTTAPGMKKRYKGIITYNKSDGKYHFEDHEGKSNVKTSAIGDPDEKFVPYIDNDTVAAGSSWFGVSKDGEEAENKECGLWPNGNYKLEILDSTSVSFMETEASQNHPIVELFSSQANEEARQYIDRVTTGRLILSNRCTKCNGTGKLAGSKDPKAKCDECLGTRLIDLDKDSKSPR